MTNIIALLLIFSLLFIPLGLDARSRGTAGGHHVKRNSSVAHVMKKTGQTKGPTASVGDHIAPQNKGGAADTPANIQTKDTKD